MHECHVLRATELNLLYRVESIKAKRDLEGEDHRLGHRHKKGWGNTF